MRKLAFLLCFISTFASAQVKSAQDIALRFETYNSLGAYQDADSLPVATLYISSIADATVVTVTDIGVGQYTATLTLPILTPGAIVQIKVNTTIDTITGGGTIFTSVADTYRVSDIMPYIIHIGQDVWTHLIDDLTVDDTVGYYLRAWLKEGKIGG